MGHPLLKTQSDGPFELQYKYMVAAVSDTEATMISAG
jgi:hypothetical protein